MVKAECSPPASTAWEGHLSSSSQLIYLPVRRVGKLVEVHQGIGGASARTHLVQFMLLLVLAPVRTADVHTQVTANAEQLKRASS